MRIAVCDDDILIGQQIRDMVCQMPEIESCRYYTDGEMLLKDIGQFDVYDVIMMDIQWEGKEKGINWSEQLLKSLPEARIIYITGYTKEYVQQVFLSPSNISGFLTKPLNQELLQKNLLKIAIEKNEYNKLKFIFRQKGEWYTLYYDKIEYFESEAHKVCLYAHSQTFEYYGKLDQIVDICPEYFLHCHKSYLVNMNKVRQFGTLRRLVMESGKEIPVSKTRYVAVKEKYFDYIRKSSMREDI